MEKHLLEIKNVDIFHGDAQAVWDVSFHADKKKILALLGANGAGKSTSMQMITGNLAPTAGQIIINGFDIIDQPIQAKSCIGYLPENPPVYRELTVDEFLIYCARLHRISASQINNALDEAKSHCGLEQVGHRLIGNLSKGFQQRVGISRIWMGSRPTVGSSRMTTGGR